METFYIFNDQGLLHLVRSPILLRYGAEGDSTADVPCFF